MMVWIRVMVEVRARCHWILGIDWIWDKEESMTTPRFSAQETAKIGWMELPFTETRNTTEGMFFVCVMFVGGRRDLGRSSILYILSLRYFHVRISRRQLDMSMTCSEERLGLELEAKWDYLDRQKNQEERGQSTEPWRTATYYRERGETGGNCKEKQSLKSCSGGSVAAATVNTGFIYWRSAPKVGRPPGKIYACAGGCYTGSLW